MSVKLISYSQANGQTMEETIAYCARVSNPAHQELSKNNLKLIQYLIKHKHWSPFEMVSICLEIETTRDIARQILRHRSFSFQEFSQRYAVADLGFEPREARLQDTKNRQNSIMTEDEVLKQQWEEKQQELITKSKEIYTWALENGIAKEQARAVLPEGNTVSRMYVNGTLRSWIHYIQLRSKNGTQKEHSLIAMECAEVIQSIFPLMKDLLEE